MGMAATLAPRAAITWRRRVIGATMPSCALIRRRRSERIREEAFAIMLKEIDQHRMLLCCRSVALGDAAHIGKKSRPDPIGYRSVVP